MTTPESLKNLNISVEIIDGEIHFRFTGGLADGILIKLYPGTVTDTEDGISIEYIAMTPPGNQAVKDEVESRLSELVNLVLTDYINHIERGKNEASI